MSNYSYPYITEHFKKVTPNHSNCKNALDFHKLAAYGAFDISNNFNGNPNELKNIFWRNIGRLCNYNDGKADCLLTDNRDSDNYKIKGGEQCSKVKNDYNNALSNLSLTSDLTYNYNLCGGDDESIIIEDVEVGKIIVNRSNDYIDECKDKPLTITKDTNRLKVSNRDDGKCQQLADEYLDKYKIHDANTRLFIKNEKDLQPMPGLVNVTEQNYNDFRDNWLRKYDRAKGESLCKGVTATNINDYNASMNNHYVNQINNKETSLLNINKTMFNDPAGQHAIQGKGPTWLDMNFLSCDREDYETLSIGERVKAKYINDHPFKSGWYGAQIKNTKDKWNAVCRNPQEPCCGMGVIKRVDEKRAKELEKEIKRIENVINDNISKRNGGILNPGFIKWKERWERNKINGPKEEGGTGYWSNSRESNCGEENTKSDAPNDYIPIPIYEGPVHTYVKTKESGVIEVSVEMKDDGEQIIKETKGGMEFPVEEIDDNYTVKARDWKEDDKTKQNKILPVFKDKEICKNYPVDYMCKNIPAQNGGDVIDEKFVDNVNKLFDTITEYDEIINNSQKKLDNLKDTLKNIGFECKCESKKYRTNPELFNDIIDKDKQGCNEMLDGLEYSIQFDNEAKVDMKDTEANTERWRTIDELKTGASWYINNRNNIHKDNKNIKQESGLIDNILKNDSDLDNTNLFTGFSDKLFGCKTKSRNINSARKTYTMDWNRLDDMGKLKYGFKGEDLHMKILSLTDKIKQKKNISTLFFTSFSIMLLYLIFKLKNKK